MRRSLVPPRSVMVYSIGMGMGGVAMSGQECVTNQQITSVIVGEDASAEYVYYNLLQRRDELRQLASAGSAQLILTKGGLGKLPISLPPLPEQRAVAQVLGSLDDKIDLNRRMNQTLEHMARALFKSWFVDFDPVRAKVAGMKPWGMDAKTAALFPDSFEESEIGRVPKGWEVRPLPEVIEVNPRRELAKGAEAPYVEMANLPTSSARVLGWRPREVGSGSRFENGDSLLARLTPCLENGKAAYVDFLPQGKVGWGSTEFLVFRPKPPLPPEFGYALLRHEPFKQFAAQNMNGSSGRQRVPAGCFGGYPVAVPTPGIAREYGDIMSSFLRLMKANDEQCHTLASLRDTLLPKLLSGEIRLPTDK